MQGDPTKKPINKTVTALGDDETQFRWLFTHLVQWGSTQEKLRLIDQVYYGWERWAQLDFFFYLIEKKIDAHVEQYVYHNTEERLDIMINFGNLTKAHFIEFKAFGIQNETGLKEFIGSVVDDIEKLESNREFHKDGFVWAIGLIPRALALKIPNGNTVYKAPIPNALPAPEERIMEQKWITELIFSHKLTNQYSLKVIYAGHLAIVYWGAFVQNGKFSRHTDYDF
ncbi:MAG: hypothetical protein M1825_003020 [Sarcosagium campestre]|nr:MAG: hypothetical protein M1825_003020 [Sarcosagium campestre]